MDSIREIQVHIGDALEQWADIMLNIEADNKAFMLHYKEKDLLNATYIFMHIMSNIGIHNGTINNEVMGTASGNELREYIKKYTGIDTHELTERIIKGHEAQTT